MSVEAVRAFLPALRELERELQAPIPDRLRILRELEYDLEQLESRLIADGISPDEARRRAIEALVPDGSTLAALDRLHAPLYRRLTRRVGDGRLRLIERTLLVLATVGVLAGGIAALFRARLLLDPSPYLWPVLGLGAALLAATAAKIFEVWIKRDHRVPARGLRAILGLSAAVLLAGLCGMVLDLYHLASLLERAPDLAEALVPVWLVRDCALLFVSIILALAGGLVWLVLAQWLALVSEARRTTLGFDPFDDSDGGYRHAR